MIREVFHLFGVHTNACRGDRRCLPTGPRPVRVYMNGWWRR